MTVRADIGIIGGSGFYSLFDDSAEVTVDTPYGEPSGALTVGALGGRSVAFLPRHGVGHVYPPHLVPYRANLWALRSLGVRQVLSLSAVGSLRVDLPIGTLVVPDQIVDRTSGRPATLYDEPRGVWHVGFADPYCPRGHAAAVAGAAAAGLDVTDRAVLVVINGPRFSTRAESQDYQARNWSIIGMTAMPEAALAREFALCYTTLALVTDLDAGVEEGSGVTHEQVLASFAENLPRLRQLAVSTIEALPETQDECSCGSVNEGSPVELA